MHAPARPHRQRDAVPGGDVADEVVELPGPGPPPRVAAPAAALPAGGARRRHPVAEFQGEGPDAAADQQVAFRAHGGRGQVVRPRPGDRVDQRRPRVDRVPDRRDAVGPGGGGTVAGRRGGKVRHLWFEPVPLPARAGDEHIGAPPAVRVDHPHLGGVTGALGRPDVPLPVGLGHVAPTGRAAVRIVVGGNAQALPLEDVHPDPGTSVGPALRAVESALVDRPAVADQPLPQAGVGGVPEVVAVQIQGGIDESAEDWFAFGGFAVEIIHGISFSAFGHRGRLG